MREVYILIKPTQEGACVLSGRDGRVLTFYDGLLARKLAEGYSTTGEMVEAVAVDLDAEEVILPRETVEEFSLDSFGLSRDERSRAARAFPAPWEGNDPAEITSREVSA